MIHPNNGLRIETTYEEWKASVYAENDIQCQDCHMRTVEDAVKVAETLKPVVVKGERTTHGAERITIHTYSSVQTLMLNSWEAEQNKRKWPRPD